MNYSVNPFYKGIDISDIKVDGAPDLKALKEKAFKQGIIDDVKKGIKVFTFRENMDIAFTPLIIFEVAWHYAFKVIENAAKLKLQETKKLCRAIRFVRESYLTMCKKDLDQKHMHKLEAVKDDFIEKCSRDLMVMWFSVSNEMKKNKNVVFVDEIRTDAYISIIMLDVLDSHNKHMDEIITKKMGHCNPYRNPFVDALREAMEAFIYPIEINVSRGDNVDLCMKIMQKNLAMIDYSIE